MGLHRLALVFSALLVAAACGGWIHGSAPDICTKVHADGDHLKIDGSIVVDDKTYTGVVTEAAAIDTLKKHCPPKH